MRTAASVLVVRIEVDLRRYWVKGSPRVAQGAMLFVTLALATSGAAVAYIEAKAYLSAGIVPRERFDALVADDIDIGLSSASHTLILRNCYEAMTSVSSRLQPTVRRSAVAANCVATADRISAEEPANSFAWYIAALAAAETGDIPGMTQRLRMSQLAGPSEQWIVELRVNLAEDHLAALSPDALAGHDGDLTLLAQSQRGVSSIAQRYVRQAGFRERITALVEKLPAEDQQRFLDYVRGAANQATGG
ncbi:hypothetical protein LJR016_002843 [Devosia sp. LjRoot16]|uniref:hypothetical protein n=1 Tax=Devosia sp. LjRoot16 TaxID=3342271 RepID=UPI003ED06D55